MRDTGMPPGYMGHIPFDAVPVTGGKIGVIEKKHPIMYAMPPLPMPHNATAAHATQCSSRQQERLRPHVDVTRACGPCVFHWGGPTSTVLGVVGFRHGFCIVPSSPALLVPHTDFLSLLSRQVLHRAPSDRRRRRRST